MKKSIQQFLYLNIGILLFALGISFFECQIVLLWVMNRGDKNMYVFCFRGSYSFYSCGKGDAIFDSVHIVMVILDSKKASVLKKMLKLIDNGAFSVELVKNKKGLRST